jgi:hypothetical protein
MAESIKELNNLFDIINGLTEKEINIILLENTEDSERLLYNIQWFLTKSCGQPNRINEKISFIKINKSEDDKKIVHNNTHYGPDLITEYNDIQSFIEHKSSNVFKTKGYLSNWIFTLDKYLTGKLEIENSKMIIESIYNSKIKNGYIIFNAIHENKLLAEYKLNGKFASILLTKMAIKNGKTTINLGSKYCVKCNKYHRMHHFQKYDEILLKRIGENEFEFKLDYFNDTEWKDILKKINFQCK